MMVLSRDWRDSQSCPASGKLRGVAKAERSFDMARIAQSTELEQPKEVAPVELSMLWQDFTIYDPGKEYIIACRKCRGRWALAKKSPPHVGNILSLMNHALSH
jgi:hypothetical protein